MMMSDEEEERKKKQKKVFSNRHIRSTLNHFDTRYPKRKY